MQKVIKEKSNGDKVIIENSILYGYSYSMLFKIFSLIFQSINSDIKGKDIKAFIDAFTTDLTNPKGTLDIQFRPIVKIENDTYYVSFNIFSGLNIVRAYITNFNISLDDQGTTFERYVKDLLEKKFQNIISKKKFRNSNGENGDIDICFLGEKSIYFMECKNRLHPISSNSSITNYEYIIKAKDVQLPKIIRYFEEDKKAFIKKYFAQEIEDIDEYKIYKFILLSNRNISGLNISMSCLPLLDKFLILTAILKSIIITWSEPIPLSAIGILFLPSIIFSSYASPLCMVTSKESPIPNNRIHFSMNR